MMTHEPARDVSTHRRVPPPRAPLAPIRRAAVREEPAWTRLVLKHTRCRQVLGVQPADPTTRWDNFFDGR